jgi:5-methyltetrahydropteroyltriglutamate--homocysteine methyltransferase
VTHTTLKGQKHGASVRYRGAVKHSTDHMLTTHVGSLPRPKDLLDLLRARLSMRVDDTEFEERVRDAVLESARAQAAHGLDVVNDGEQSKFGFSRYVTSRLDGFEARPRTSAAGFGPEVEDFPEYYEQYFKRAMMGGSIAPATTLVCVGPVRYQGEAELQRDLANLHDAVTETRPTEAFVSAVAPSGVGRNEYYESNEDYFFAVADALKVEYRAIVAAGFVLQVDDPWLSELFSFSRLPADEMHAEGELYVAAVNRALEGIAPDRVRYHTCYGINEGPRVHDAPLADLVDLLLKVNAGAYSFEGANARHEHEYHVWERVSLPPEKMLIPGVITHASNIVEHPELVAERITRLARIVGRENVMAGADCGFSSQATYNPEVHPKIMWAKFDALREGAQLATKALWS